ARIGTIYIDAEDLAGQRAEILPCEILIGDPAGVACTDVEESIGTKLQTAAVVTSAWPLDNDLLAMRIAYGRLTRLHAKPRYARARWQLFLQVDDVRDIHEAVLDILRVRRKTVGVHSLGSGAA